MTDEHSIVLKRCSKCGISKPLSDFWLDARVACGHRYQCKACATTSRTYTLNRKPSQAEEPRRTENPATYLKPGEPLMVDGLDWSWAYVWYKDIADFPGYCVGVDGSVWTCIRLGPNGIPTGRWRRLKLRLLPHTGYLEVKLSRGKRRLVHRLVLEAFVGPCPPGLECRHFPDRDRTNNRLDNIHWGTRDENVADKIIHGTSGKGEKNPRAVLTDVGVIEVLAMHRAGRSSRAIARWFNVAPITIRKILHGESWGHVTGLEPMIRP